jgi:dihydrofolate synthase / folylpolyglutamate synthase
LHTYWPVRFQYFAQENLLLDGSHNEDGFKALAESLALYYPDTPKLWLISLRANRNPSQLLELIERFGKPLGVVVTQAHPTHLYHSAESLAAQVRDGLGKQCPILTEESPTDALTALKQLQRQSVQANPLGIITGSLYTAGEILHCLNRG